MDTPRYTEIVEALRRGGGRVTASRRSVVRALLDADHHHLTATQVIEAVRRTDPQFQESTVYRTLDRLVELGIVDHLHLGTGAAVYHLSDEAHRHQHLVCERCGRVLEVTPTLLDGVARRVARDHGFRLDTRSASLTGLCATCVLERAMSATARR